MNAKAKPPPKQRMTTQLRREQDLIHSLRALQIEALHLRLPLVAQAIGVAASVAEIIVK